MAPIPKPRNLAEYRLWLDAQLGIILNGRFRTHYDTVVQRLREGVETSEFWRNLSARVSDIDGRYYVHNGVYLFMTQQMPEVLAKPYESSVDKSFRKNILSNKENWPDAPPGDWITPAKWFSQLNDLVRTTLVVKYLDGVPFLTTELEKLGSELNLHTSVDFEARMEGYYAAHTYVTLEAEVPRIDWDTERIPFAFEIQVTTQLQDAIRPVTHPFYAARRSVPPTAPLKPWQWQFETDEFRANYLAHTLHHVEGLIVDVRDRMRRVR